MEDRQLEQIEGTIEEECEQIFELGAGGKYRCIYCEQELQVK